MTTDNRNLESWLVELGNARNDGAFTGSATRYPWQAAEPKVISLAHKRLAWVRFAAPLAAAAAVAVLFVGPSLFSTPGTDSTAPAITGLAGTETKDVGSLAEVPAPTPEQTCDFNGDGVVNGLDIQSLVDRAIRGGDDDPMAMAKATENLKSCLLLGM
jgi:hypothetical protein